MSKSPPHHEALEHLFVTSEPADEAPWGEVLRSDQAARAHYEQLALASRELEHIGPGERSSFERALGEASFLSALDAQLERERAPAAPVIPLPRKLARWAPLIAAAAALLLAFAVFAPGPEDDEFRARSASPPVASPAQLSAPRLALFCVSRDAQGGIEFSGEKDAPFGLLACSKQAELKIAHTRPDAALGYVAVFGVDERGDIKWYGPSPAARDAVSIATTATQALYPVGESIRLGVNHAPGTVRVHAIFSTHPLDYDKLDALVRAQPRRELLERQALQLGEAGLVATSKTFDVMEGL